MNKTYDINSNIHSNNGIYKAFYDEMVAPSLRGRETLRRGLIALKKLRAVLVGATAKRLTVVGGVVGSLMGIVGLAGGIQHGKISILGGLLLAASFVAIEYACLKWLEKSADKK